MERKKILNDTLFEEIKNMALFRFNLLKEKQKTVGQLEGIIFELLVKHNPPLDPSIPRNTDPELTRLEQVIIPLMEKEGLFTPDIILMSHPNEDKRIITIYKIGEIKLGFRKINHIRTQRENFFNGLEKLSEDFEEIIRRGGVVLSTRYQILKPKRDCPLFYVLPKDVELPEEISSTEVFHFPFSSKDIYRIARDLIRSQGLPI